MNEMFNKIAKLHSVRTTYARSALHVIGDLDEFGWVSAFDFDATPNNSGLRLLTLCTVGEIGGSVVDTANARWLREEFGDALITATAGYVLDSPSLIECREYTQEMLTHIHDVMRGLEDYPVICDDTLSDVQVEFETACLEDDWFRSDMSALIGDAAAQFVGEGESYDVRDLLTDDDGVWERVVLRRLDDVEISWEYTSTDATPTNMDALAVTFATAFQNGLDSARSL